MSVYPPADPPPRRVAFFPGCLADALLPQVARAAHALLRRLEIAVDPPPGQVCCGQALFKAGHVRRSAQVAKAWVGAFAGAQVVVGASGSCVAHVRQHLPGLLAHDPRLAQTARDLADRTWEISQFVFRVLGITRLAATAPQRPWAYHPSCGLHRALGEDQAPWALLDGLSGRPRLELPRQERCCGFGGPFSLSHPEISGGLLKDKLKAAHEIGAQVLAVGDVGCLMHLKAGADQRAPDLEVAHLYQVLAGEVA